MADLPEIDLDQLEESRRFWEGVAEGTIQPSEPTAALHVLEWIGIVQSIYDAATGNTPEGELDPEIIPQTPEDLVFDVPDEEAGDWEDTGWDLDDETEE